MEKILYVVMVHVTTDLIVCEGVFDSQTEASLQARTVDPTGKTVQIHRAALNPPILLR